MNKNIRCVLFDLDGTLIDTAPDIVAALNHTLSEEGAPPVDQEHARNTVSHGTAALIKLGFGDSQAEPDYRRRIQMLLDHYEANLSRLSRPFDGVPELLCELESRSIAWGVVTNKPAWLTDPLMKQLDLTHRSACVISGDSTAHPKPHPLPMMTAAELAGVSPEYCLYLGDAERDIEAGNAASMGTLIASWGYIEASQNTRAWGADGSLNHPLECLNWL